ncbi:MAG: hypothetical protein M1370_00175 [Bacteroidetes bacterium]|nr:hypothetical protein [Bacteroidota bacterium]
MKVLHLLRSLDDERALATVRTHAAEHPTSLLLLQDAVLDRIPAFQGTIYALAEDVAARGKVADYEEIDYDEMVRLIFRHDKVISW